MTPSEYVKRGSVVAGVEGDRPFDLAARARANVATAATLADALSATLADLEIPPGAAVDIANELRAIAERLGAMLNDLVAPSLEFEHRVLAAREKANRDRVDRERTENLARFARMTGDQES